MLLFFLVATGCAIIGYTDGCRCLCGIAKRKTRIVGGQETEVNEYPWQVRLDIKYRNDNKRYLCGGSVISNKWILTAAHCTHDAAEIKAFLGDHDRTHNTESNMVVRVLDVDNDIVEHPDYNHPNPNYDISLLKIARIYFYYYPHIRPICLPVNDNNNYKDYVAIVSGWGRTSEGGPTSDVLMEVSVNVLSNNDCKNNYGYPSSSITNQMICANEDGGGKDSCQGDSGGPLVTSGAGDGVTAGQNYELIGVVSWGWGCARPNNPGVYARVSKQLDWIATTTATGWNTCPRN